MTSSTSVRRFTVSDRVEHWVQVIAFTVLAVTGLVQRYDEAWISERIIDLFGGIESTRNIHRVFATILMVAVVYHFGSAGYRRFVRKEPRSMVPATGDIKAIWSSIKFSFGRTDTPPRQGRFSWEEKVEYWAFLWGTVVMVITGFLLWNPIATATFLPGELIPTAKAAHGGEAVLAVLAIIVWHVYHVHFRHFNKSMYSGNLSRAEMKKYHPLELASIEAAEYLPPSTEERNHRLMRFLPVYGALATVLLLGVYVFVTFEDTAITTIEPQEQVQVFVPVETVATTTTTAAPTTTTTTTTPTSTTDGTTTTTQPAVTGDTWDDTISAFFDPTCTGCHGTSGGLALSSYAAALAGGSLGPGVVPGDADESVIVRVMEAGGHPQQLSAEDVATLRAWIDDGAAETAADIPTEPPSASGDTWNETIAAFFDPTCTGCHGTSGGLDLSSYAAALAGGSLGPGVVPGDAEASVIVRVMEAGGHPQQLSAEDLATLRAWIDGGAAETAAPTEPPAAAGEMWAESIGAFFDPTCTACHGDTAQLSGLRLTSFEDALAGGSLGPGVVPGDADGSVIVQVMEAGGHPQQLSAEDLAALRAWIEAGVP